MYIFFLNNWCRISKILFVIVHQFRGRDEIPPSLFSLPYPLSLSLPPSLPIFLFLSLFPSLPPSFYSEFLLNHQQTAEIHSLSLSTFSFSPSVSLSLFHSVYSSVSVITPPVLFLANIYCYIRSI